MQTYEQVFIVHYFEILSTDVHEEPYFYLLLDWFAIKNGNK
jgi:hypothetical protein